jgi:enoyl-CoA hydratase/carnithine racemase
MAYINMTHLQLMAKDHTLWITLDRPDQSNAFSVEMIQNLVSTLYRADEDNDIRTIVITGSGKHFCAGGDVKDMQNKTGMFSGESNELRERYKRGIQQIPICMNTISTPVIAMINGAAIGAGLDLSCMCDIRVSSNKAKFGETFAKLGLIPGDGGTYFLQRIIGFSKAMELTLTCEVINSTEAKDIGLVNYVVGADELKTFTETLLAKINGNAPIALQMAKRAIVHGYRNDLSSNLELLSAFQGITQRTSDHFESVEKILTKENSDFNHK